jgi:hypothetical protein
VKVKTEMNDEKQPSSSQSDEVSISQRDRPITTPGQVDLPEAMVDGRPFIPQTPVVDSQLNVPSVQKRTKGVPFFMVLALLQIVGIALYFLVMLAISQQAKAGESGTEFIALFVFATIVPAVAIIALINLIGLPIYLLKHRPRGKWLVISIISLVMSVILVGYGVYTAYGLYVYPRKLAEQSRQKSEKTQQEFATDNAKPEITKEEAIRLLQACKLKGFYYTKQTDKSDPANGGWGELSSTGVVLTKVDKQPYRISIADRLIAELVPIARQAQKTCGGPQFWHDGAYEQYKDGKWYFKGEVVNTTVKSGNTKDEVVSFMQACKADYFVGYTDINLVKDSNVRTWLNEAEQSSSGIEILEDSPKSYVFASKSMTAALQDTARQLRQSCYSKKKLYIMIDNWVETEYPTGRWTRVNQ